MSRLPARWSLACAFALLLLPVAAAGGERPEARWADGLLRLDAGHGEERDGWAEGGPRCVLRSVFDPVDGVEHAGTGAWLEVELVVDRADGAAGPRPSAWGARLQDWHHEASFWLVRDGLREGVILASGEARTPLLPLDVSRLRHYRLSADETGARLQVDGRTRLWLPLEPRRRPGEPAALVGLGTGALDAGLSRSAQGCLRPVGARVLERRPDGGLRVALLGHEGFRPALSVVDESLRAGDAPARPGSLREEDADGDGHLDLVGEFDGARAPDGVLRVEALDLDGERLTGWDLLDSPASARR